MQKLSSPIDLIKKSIDIFRKKENFIFILKIYIPVLILSFFGISLNSSGMSARLQKGDFSFFPNSIYLIIPIVLIVVAGIIFSIWFQAASLESILRVVNGGVFDVKDTYKKAWKYAAKLFWANLLVGLITLGGFILLVIPGIIFMIWYAFVQFDIAEGEALIGNALRKSKSLVKGRFWSVLGRIVTFGVFGILVQIVLGLLPYNVGDVLITLLGALFIIPSYLLYQELSVVSS